ncbi:mRNA splicing, via spliceosome, partial [Rhizoctonia solani]
MVGRIDKIRDGKRAPPESRATRQAYTTHHAPTIASPWFPSIGTSTAPPTPQVNGVAPATNGAPGPVATSTTTPSNVPPEIEYTLSRLSGHRNVRGVLVLARQGAIIRYSGVAFEGEQGRKYAAAVKKIVDCCRTNIEEVGDEGAIFENANQETRINDIPR